MDEPRRRKVAVVSRGVTKQFGWYFDEAGEGVAWRFFKAVDLTLLKLARQSDLGRARRFRNPMLRGLWSFRVESPQVSDLLSCDERHVGGVAVDARRTGFAAQIG